MSDLTSIEKLRLEKFLGMREGYVLEFSNKTFEDFILENTNVNIYSEKYSYGSGSKANRLRAFWDKESNYLTGKLVSALLEQWKTQNELNQKETTQQELNAYNECSKIADRLKLETPIDNLEILQSNTNDKNFNLLAKGIKKAIEKNEPEAALDRLHTFVFKYLRQLCEKHQITISKEDPLHSVFGKYIKYLSKNNLFESAMAERILKSSISVLEAFNDVRNNKSFAHDNPILNYQESLLIFNSVTNTFKFIESIEDTFDEKNKQAINNANAWDDLPF